MVEHCSYGLVNSQKDYIIYLFFFVFFKGSFVFSVVCGEISFCSEIARLCSDTRIIVIVLKFLLFLVQVF